MMHACADCCCQCWMAVWLSRACKWVDGKSCTHFVGFEATSYTYRRGGPLERTRLWIEEKLNGLFHYCKIYSPIQIK